MAFSYTVLGKDVVGDKVRTYGTYTCTAVTGGDIDTKMDRCIWIRLQPKAATVALNQPVANESFPCNGHAVTIVTDSGEVGYWEAEGEGLGW